MSSKTPQLRASRYTEGSLFLPRDFLDRSVIERADLLEDWIGLLVSHYNETVAELSRSPKAIVRNVDAANLN